jgi:hypothetical protein
MKFTRTGPNSACTESFEVKIAKRDQLHYIEGAKLVVVPIEIGVDRVIAIATSQVPSGARQEIQKRIDEALEFLAIPHRFDT